jgi:hypothetical protein
MQIIEKYSHLNGEEYLIVHHKDLYDEIKDVIHEVKANELKTKKSEEKIMKGRLLYTPDGLNREFKRLFKQRNWESAKYSYYITTEYSTMQELINLPLNKQKELLIKNGIESPIYINITWNTFFNNSLTASSLVLCMP